MGWADEIPGNPVLIGFRPTGFFQTAEGLHRALVLRGGNAPKGLLSNTSNGEQFERDWALPSPAGEEEGGCFYLGGVWSFLINRGVWKLEHPDPEEVGGGNRGVCFQTSTSMAWATCHPCSRFSFPVPSPHLFPVFLQW